MTSRAGWWSHLTGWSWPSTCPLTSPSSRWPRWLPLGQDLELRSHRGRRATFLMAHVATPDGTVFLCDTSVGFIVLLAEDEVNREAVRHALRAAMEHVRQACA